MSASSINSEEFYLGVKKRIDNDIRKLQLNGVIPLKYKPLGISPRIIPVGYGEKINGVKRIVRQWDLFL